MDVIQAIIIGIVQGITEFLPISSSAHLVFIRNILGVQESLAFDTMLHLASLVAVVSYFRKDLLHMLKSFLSSLNDLPKGEFKKGIQEDPFKRLAWLILFGTIPAGLMGLLFKDFFESLFTNLLAVGFFLIVTGLLLWASERISTGNKSVKDMGLKTSMLIGIAQGCAIAPGISRSGATISAGLFLGLERELAARYSFLLSIPIIIAAGLIQVREIGSVFDFNAAAFIAGFIASAVAAYLAIKLLLKIIKERSLMMFAYYCWIVGLLTIIFSILS